MTCGLERVIRMMKLKKHYDLVSDDSYDSRIPLHNEEAFKHGIQFQAKYIGTLDVPRPSSRVEIVAAMRRIRYEFKAKAIKKKKVNLIVSVDGIKIALRTKKKRNTQWTWDDSRLMVMSHPIYRIFYVSHDSQDLKVFSYIARNGSTNVFKCNVFKAYKKSQAMRIVRTVGQAFEVCHKISIQGAAARRDSSPDAAIAADDEKSLEEADGVKHSLSMPEKVSVGLRSEMSCDTLDSSQQTQSSDTVYREAQQQLMASMVAKANAKNAGPTTSFSSPLLHDMLSPTSPLTVSFTTPASPADQLPLSSTHQLTLLRQHIEQQQQQTQVAMEQVQLLKDQLAAETSARIEAQSRNHHLMVQNRELLEHINVLVTQLQEVEAQARGLTPISGHSNSQSSDVMSVAETSTPEPGQILAPIENTFSSPNPKLVRTDSPDSGHKEMSSDNLAYPSASGDTWYQPMSQLLAGGDKKPGITAVNQGQSTLNNNTRSSSARRDFNLPLNNTSTYAGFNSTTSVTDQNANMNNQNRTGEDRNETHIITPLPRQDATGNKLELGLAPKIDPPPKVIRNSNRSRSSFSDFAPSPDSNGNTSAGGSNRSSLTSSASSGDGQTINKMSMSANLLLDEGEELDPLEALNNLNLVEEAEDGVDEEDPDKHSAVLLLPVRPHSLSDDENSAEWEETRLTR